MTDGSPRDEGPAGDSFAVVERRIAVTRKRLRGFPHERATLARLVTHVQKRQQELCNLVLRQHDLNYASYTALMMLYGSDGQRASASELAQASGEKPTNVTRIGDELLAKGLIERQPCSDDRRRVLLRLTTRGERLVEKFQPEIWPILDRLYGGLTAAELRTLTQLLRRALARLEA